MGLFNLVFAWFNIARAAEASRWRERMEKIGDLIC
jgi:hypothetical protein